MHLNKFLIRMIRWASQTQIFTSYYYRVVLAFALCPSQSFCFLGPINVGTDLCGCRASNNGLSNGKEKEEKNHPIQPTRNVPKWDFRESTEYIFLMQFNMKLKPRRNIY